MTGPIDTRPLRAAGTALGIGMGGFLDGIVFHQILRLHNMLSARIPSDTLVGTKVNMVWDGVFHMFVWLMTLLGIVLLWNAGRRRQVPSSGKTLAGAMLIGWGLFNLIEGLIDHQLLGLHHVVQRLGPSIWDWVFLSSGVVLIAAGYALVRPPPRS